ncbi:uncharacterized protein LY79DRAFT_396548 [Colletotrichum navitas]|uniref:Uncharacterized protein n=1 Tax=Colletotrichum navitas TaxID=681940 RepID=A0AAD8UYJ2_9PEZI|nr:uncharacterized protein LY79DRAFT_396548 [Colletotrichum navitas]KAK1573866.1 hypothetical protein LY79DRAFT_396548 [Colletotrichum navitas]
MPNSISHIRSLLPPFAPQHENHVTSHLSPLHNKTPLQSTTPRRKLISSLHLPQ